MESGGGITRSILRGVKHPVGWYGPSKVQTPKAPWTSGSVVNDPRLNFALCPQIMGSTTECLGAF